jgi:hypothetical protein
MTAAPWHGDAGVDERHLYQDKALGARRPAGAEDPEFLCLGDIWRCGSLTTSGRAGSR